MRSSDFKTVDFEQCVAFYQAGSDRQADPELARWLDDNPATAQRAARQATIQQYLQDRYDPVIDEPIPRRLLIGSQRPHMHWPARVAAAATLVVVVSSIWWLQGQSPQQSQSPAPADRLVAKTTLNPDPDRVARTSLIEPPDLSAQGYKLIATRTMPNMGTPALEFVYTNRRGERVRIYAQPQPQRLTHNPQAPSGTGVARVHWRDDGVDYLLIGALPKRTLQTLARSVTTPRAETVSQPRQVRNRVVEPLSPELSPGKPEVMIQAVDGAQAGGT